MTVPPRQPYSGELVFTAFSRFRTRTPIKKGLTEWKPGRPFEIGDVPYLTIDPSDLNREYREIIRGQFAVRERWSGVFAGSRVRN